MSKARKMNDAEKRIYNQAQEYYKLAQYERDKALDMYDARLKEEAKAKKEESDRVKESKLAGERQEFSNRINRICVGLSDLVRKESLQIYGGIVTTSPWGDRQSGGMKIFTLHNYSFPRMTADVYAVANKGFRWDIKMS